MSPCLVTLQETGIWMQARRRRRGDLELALDPGARTCVTVVPPVAGPPQGAGSPSLRRQVTVAWERISMPCSRRQRALAALQLPGTRRLLRALTTQQLLQRRRPLRARAARRLLQKRRLCRTACAWCAQAEFGRRQNL